MPYLRAAQTPHKKSATKAAAKPLSGEDFEEKVAQAVREMKHMNSLLHSIELILSGM